MLQHILNWLTPPARKPATRRRNIVLGVETLERRIVPASTQHFRFYTTEAVRFAPVQLCGFNPVKGSNAADYKAVVTWGDGQRESVPVKQGTGNSRNLFVVQAGHRYNNEGPYKSTVDVTDKKSGKLAVRAAGEFLVRNARLDVLNVASVNSVTGATISGTLATFRDTRALGADPVGHYKAIVNWGDGSVSPGQILLAGTKIEVAGTHIYKRAANYVVTVKLLEDDGGRWKDTSLYCTYQEVVPGTGGAAQTRASLRIAPFDAKKSQDAVGKAFAEFFGGISDRAGALGKFMTSNALANQTAMATGIAELVRAFVTDPGKASGNLVKAVEEAFGEIEQNPARFLGGVVFDVLLGKVTKLAQTRLANAGQVLPGISNLKPGAGMAGLEAGAAASGTTALEGSVSRLAGETARAALDRQVLQGYILRSAQELRSVNYFQGTKNCVNCAASGVHFLKGIKRVVACQSDGLPKEAAERYFGAKFSAPLKASELAQRLRTSTNPGAVGVLRVPGHQFNFINMHGEIHFVDFQLGAATTDLSQLVRSGPNTMMQHMDCSHFKVAPNGPLFINLG